MKQLLILSGKGGTGKTTIASAFIKLSGAKAFADCDVDAPNLHLVMKQESDAFRSHYFGMPKAFINPDLCRSCGMCKLHCRFDAVLFSARYLIDQVSCEGCGVCTEICPAQAISLVPCQAGELSLYRNEDKSVFSTAQLKMGSGTTGKLVTEVKRRMISSSRHVDFAIIDGSPGIGCPVIASLSGVDMVLIVAEPSVCGISDMERILATAKKFKVKTAVCINKSDINPDHSERIRSYCSGPHISSAGEIPYDRGAVEAANRGRSIADMECVSGKAVRSVYHETMALFYDIL